MFGNIYKTTWFGRPAYYGTGSSYYLTTGTGILNGDFSEEGSELITNGDFASDSDWTKGTGTTISGGKANFSSATGVSLYQNIGTQSGTVKVTFTITNYTSGTLNVYSGGNKSVGTVNVTANALGLYTVFVDRNGGNNNIIFGSSSNFTGSIDNVSVVEVGQHWIYGPGWSTIDGEGRYTPPGAQYSNLRQNASFTSGDVVRVQFNLTDNDTNGIYVRIQSGTWSPLITGTGWKMFDLTVGSTTNAQFEIGPGYATKSVALDNIFIIPVVS